MEINKSVTVLELNELCPDLIAKFIDAGELPNFKRFLMSSTAMITEAGEEQENLEPWIQWVTVHTGKNFAEHQVFLLGEGESLKHQTIASVVAQLGGRVWQCGSMNIPCQVGENIRFLPDPWARTAEPSHNELKPFSILLGPMQEHTNKKPKFFNG